MGKRQLEMWGGLSSFLIFRLNLNGEGRQDSQIQSAMGVETCSQWRTRKHGGTMLLFLKWYQFLNSTKCFQCFTVSFSCHWCFLFCFSRILYIIASFSNPFSSESLSLQPGRMKKTLLCILKKTTTTTKEHYQIDVYIYIMLWKHSYPNHRDTLRKT